MKILGYLSLCVMFLLMAAALFLFLAPRFGWRVDAVLSGSMEPELRVGGIAVARPEQAQEIRPGNIITFYSPLKGEVTTHRVIALVQSEPYGFRTKGDANAAPDPFVVPPDNLAGKVCFHLPFVGFVTEFVKSRLGLFMTLFTPGLIIVGMEIRSIWQELTIEEIERKYRIG